MTALKEGDGRWLALAEPEGRYRHCNNAVHDACNWLVPADSPDSSASPAATTAPSRTCRCRTT